MDMELVDAITGYAGNAASGVMRLFTAPGSFLSPLPLVIAIGLGAVIILVRQKKSTGKISMRTLLAGLFPENILRHRSARNDVWIIVINEGLFFFLPLVAFFAVGYFQQSLADVFSLHDELARQPLTQIGIMIVFAIYYTLVWDFFATFAHYLKHKVPFLWEFHKVHHCAEVLTPLTAMRRHPVEVIIGGMITGTGSALALLLWVVTFGAPGSAFEIAGQASIVYAWRLLGYNLRHSHIWLSYGPFWNNILVSPAHHQLHHSREARHHDCNFGHIFSFWDRLFGTLYQPNPDEKFELGIEKHENEKLQTISQLYIRPVQQALLHFAPNSKSQQSDLAR